VTFTHNGRSYLALEFTIPWEPNKSWTREGSEKTALVPDFNDPTWCETIRISPTFFIHNKPGCRNTSRELSGSPVLKISMKAHTNLHIAKSIRMSMTTLFSCRL
jgi:hypothetical protein